MSEGPPVLIVDDELPIRRFLRISLETNSYRVYEAENGTEALAKAAQLRPEVVILDMNLPDMEGVEVLRRLREWTTTPVIILSVRDADRDKVAALDAGADDYLTKPFSTDEFLARVRVARRHAQPAAADASGGLSHRADRQASRESGSGVAADHGARRHVSRRRIHIG